MTETTTTPTRTTKPARNGTPTRPARTRPTHSQPEAKPDGLDWIRRLLADEEAMAYYDDLIRHQSTDISFDEDGFDQYKCAVLLDQAMSALCEKVGLPSRIHIIHENYMSRLGPAVPE